MDDYFGIIERIRGEVIILDKIVNKSIRAWKEAGKSPMYQDLFLDSVSLNLHGFYMGLERLFEIIAKNIDKSFPSDNSNWHISLLKQMTIQNNIRPSILSKTSYEGLNEFRKFRHIVRHIYSTSIAPEKMINMMKGFPEIWNQTNKELLAFADYLEELNKNIT